jgi:hypothetical protein
MNDPATDGYVECDECGHQLERHDLKGCHGVPGCLCSVKLTRLEIRQVRQRAGLPARWEGA